MYRAINYIHLLKLVTGVEISTRPVSKSGSPGNEVNSKSRKAAAAPNRAAFRRSTLISICGQLSSHFGFKSGLSFWMLNKGVTWVRNTSLVTVFDSSILSSGVRVGIVVSISQYLAWSVPGGEWFSQWELTSGRESWNSISSKVDVGSYPQCPKSIIFHNNFITLYNRNNGTN